MDAICERDRISKIQAYQCTQRHELYTAGCIASREIEMVLMFSNQFSERILLNYAIRRLAVDYGVPLITNVQVASMFASALERAGARATPDHPNTKVVLDTRSLQSWYE